MNEKFKLHSSQKKNYSPYHDPLCLGYGHIDVTNLSEKEAWALRLDKIKREQEKSMDRKFKAKNRNIMLILTSTYKIDVIDSKE